MLATQYVPGSRVSKVGTLPINHHGMEIMNGYTRAALQHLKRHCVQITSSCPCLIGSSSCPSPKDRHHQPSSCCYLGSCYHHLLWMPLLGYDPLSTFLTFSS